MKTPFFLTCLFAILLASCSGSSQNMEAIPIVLTVEITRIVQITTTPIPTETMTPAPTLDTMDQGGISVAERIGTPIVASDECYKIAKTQMDLNACAGTRLQELENRMTELLTAIEAHYEQRFPEGLEKFQNFHAEWEDFSDRECISRSGFDSDGWVGTMASMNYGECMVAKYEDRLREYQIQLFEWTN